MVDIGWDQIIVIFISVVQKWEEGALRVSENLDCPKTIISPFHNKWLFPKTFLILIVDSPTNSPFLNLLPTEGKLSAFSGVRASLRSFSFAKRLHKRMES